MLGRIIIINVFSVTVAVLIVSYLLRPPSPPPPPKSKSQSLLEAFQNDQFRSKEQHVEGSDGDGQSTGHASEGAHTDGGSGYYTETEGGTSGYFA